MIAPTDDQEPSRTGAVEMTQSAIAEFLVEHGDGVLSFAGDAAYSLPVSFGYDRDAGRPVFQFLSAPDSAKADYLRDGARARLVVYDWTSPDDWASVVVAGTLCRVADPGAVSETYHEQATPVSLSVFDAPSDSLDADWFALHPDERTGRQSPR
jgi:nitroimidazol reductase NimA-like FMN-containing flavoprotein (pyridoxamine 5'-phosphate oxidase superfamily)